MLLILMVFLVISATFSCTIGGSGSNNNDSSNQADVPLDVCELESCPFCGGDESQVLTITDAAHMCPQSPLYGMSKLYVKVAFCVC